MLACNSGGPKESVLHGSTGFLAEPEAGSFARAMAQLVVSLFPASALRAAHGEGSVWRALCGLLGSSIKLRCS